MPERTRRLAVASACDAGAALLVSLSANGVSLVVSKRAINSNSERITEIEQERGVRRAANAFVHEHSCRQIELLKENVRQAAIESAKNLERNARLLEIKITPELRKVVAESRDRTLERYKPIEGGTKADPYKGCEKLPLDPNAKDNVEIVEETS